MNFEKVAECFYCLSCSAKTLSFIVSPSQKKDTGIFLCAECGEFYALKDGILDARPQDLQDPAKKNLIQKEYQDYLLKNSQKPKKETPFHRDASEEFTFEEAEPAFYDQQLLASPFWQKVERKTLHTWPDFVKKHVSTGYVLDAGCGTGRVSNYLAEKGIEMIAFDVTLPMLQIARRKAQEKGVEDKILYVLADIYHMPFLKGSLTGLSFFGVFHHLKSPNRAFERCLDCLAPQAIVCGMDNHRSIFRGIFDWLMRIKPLWEEDEMPYQLPSGDEFKEIMISRGFDVVCKTTCFIPPHFYRIFPEKIANGIYDFFDFLLTRIPGLSHQGGLFTCQGVKRNTNEN